MCQLHVINSRYVHFTVNSSELIVFSVPCPGNVHIEKLQEEVRECNTKIHQLSLKLKQQDDDILYLREELKRLLTELSMTRVTLKEVVDKL